MTQGPYVKVWALDQTCSYPVVKPGTVKREFLDATFKAHGYHCQPLTTANLHGWDFILPQDVVVTWDGVSSTSSEHVKVLEGKNLPNGTRLVDTATGNATLTFNLNAMVETDSNHYSLLVGPPNHFVKGAKPMTALIRTDYYFYNSLQYCWVITAPNKPVTFKAGTPFVTLINYPKNLLEETKIEILPITESLINKREVYGKERQASTAKLKADSPGFGSFPGLYKKGLVPEGEGLTRVIDTIYKPKPQDPVIPSEQ